MKRNKRWIIMVVLMAISVLLGSIFSACECSMATINSFPAAMDAFISPADTFISPVKSLRGLSALDPYRYVTAAQSFPVAYKIAKSWHRNAKWYGIVPFTSIERAFAIPLDNSSPSWFFRFGVPEEDREIIVEVLNGQIVGMNETKIPDYIEPPLQELEPIGDRWTIMDSVEVLDKYHEEKDNLLARFPYMLVDYRLAMPKGYPHPIWTLYNAQNLTEPIFIIDAVTGDVFR